MKKALDFLKNHSDVAFATVDSECRPNVRVFQVMMIEGTSLYFATSSRKEVYRQLTVNPNVEILAMKDNISVRIAGMVHFDVLEDKQQAIYQKNPVLQRLYADYKRLVYFRIPIEKLDYYDLTPEPPVLDSYIL